MYLNVLFELHNQGFILPSSIWPLLTVQCLYSAGPSARSWVVGSQRTSACEVIHLLQSHQQDRVLPWTQMCLVRQALSSAACANQLPVVTPLRHCCWRRAAGQKAASACPLPRCYAQLTHDSRGHDHSTPLWIPLHQQQAWTAPALPPVAARGCQRTGPGMSLYCHVTLCVPPCPLPRCWGQSTADPAHHPLLLAASTIPGVESLAAQWPSSVRGREN